MMFNPRNEMLDEIDIYDFDLDCIDDLSDFEELDLDGFSDAE